MPGQDGDDELLALQLAVYQQEDPTADEALLTRLIETVRARSTPEPKPSFPSADRSLRLGPDTTGLTVESVIRFPELPTALYPLLDPAQEPLLLVHVRNTSNLPRRVRVMAWLEGLSAQVVKTVELRPTESALLQLSPTLLPDTLSTLDRLQWATLHVVADDLDGKQERHDTFPVLCLARSAGFTSAVVDPKTGQARDLTRYYGAWVTPFAEPVQQLIRQAAELLPNGRMRGYQPPPAGLTVEQSTEDQVRALYQALQKLDIAYVHSVINHGVPRRYVAQRTRLPRETLQTRSANCLDAVVLMASLLEGASLEPALVFVPGHAFLGWRTERGVESWHFLEVSMLRTKDFDAARESGEKQYAHWKNVNLRFHPVAKLREERIWPME
ncbi:hypothetical protein BO221_45395 [Archangium sp. Cb G35]|uniref:hypothetical protein n=1 Tax=Archangium sp. Cb G35 TaxID=1920190 RepID=UPI000936F124|nr:hypothetical protein [Archangium sp. Cb G35]OJT17358.1 hypothetical protein BO221_45395 [Archangium sp. Cb G35]